MPLDTDAIRTLRMKLGLSQEDAARKAGIGGKQVWYKIESGRNPNVTLATVEAMAATLGVPLAKILKAK